MTQLRRNPSLSDDIQERCIARMKELGLNPNQLGDILEGKMSKAHVADFLTRRSSMGSHKLQHLLKVLGLEVQPSVQPKTGGNS